MEQEVNDLEERLNHVSAFKDIQEISGLLEAKRKELEEKESRWMELADRAE
jgi:hypothetical protein